MGILCLFVLFRIVFRRTWAAAAAVVGLVVAAGLASSRSPVAAIVFSLDFAVIFCVTLRFGIVAGTLVLVISTLVGNLPLTWDLSAWYASRGLIAMALTAALAIWSFRHALAGRRVLNESFLDG
jgi:hypothetical protein